MQFKPCSVDGCKGHAHRDARGMRGWCRTHYRRWLQHGDPLCGRTPNGEPLRFAERNLNTTSNDCIEWPYGKGQGYGKITVDGVGCDAHHYVCERAHGVAPAGKYHAAHSCGNRACINPNHLSWKTPLENKADELSHGTRNRGERCGKAKITEAQAREIIRLKGKMTQREIAEKLNTTKLTVSHIHAGRSWSWLFEKCAEPHDVRNQKACDSLKRIMKSF